MKNYFYILVVLISSSFYAQSNFKIADSLYAVGRYEEAIAVMQKEDTSKIKVLTDLAKYYQANSDYNRALESYQKILAKDSMRVLIALKYGEVLLQNNQLQIADSLYDKLNNRFPENALFYYSRGLVQERMGKDSLAFDLYQKTQSLDQYHQNALYKLAKKHLKNKQYQDALVYSLMGLEKNDNNSSLHSIAGQTYSAMAVFYKGIPHYDKLIALGQGSAFIHSKLAYAYYKDGDFKKAIENYHEALLYEPGNSSTHYLLGKLYAMTNDFKSSEKHLLMAIKIKDQPMDAEYFSLGRAYKKLEQPKDAFQSFQKALKENPEHLRAMYERAVAADNYFKDLDTKINYYQIFWNTYYQDDSYIAKDMLSLTKNRIADLKKKKHMVAKNENAEEKEERFAEVNTDSTENEK